MHKYCKAYHIQDLRQFPFWNEHHEEDESELDEETVVYLWDDFTVVKSPVMADQGILWKRVTPEWEAFCKETLNFAIPEDLRYAYEHELPSSPDGNLETSTENTSSVKGA